MSQAEPVIGVGQLQAASGLGVDNLEDLRGLGM